MFLHKNILMFFYSEIYVFYNYELKWSEVVMKPTAMSITTDDEVINVTMKNVSLDTRRSKIKHGCTKYWLAERCNFIAMSGYCHNMLICCL